MTNDLRPLPKPDRDSAIYWEAAKRHELLLQQCSSCQRFRFYPRVICPHCFSESFEWRRASGTGRIYSFTTIHRAPFPSFADKVPYTLALIELDEGVRMMSNIIDCDPTTVEIGMRVEVTFEDLTEEISLPQFKAVTTGGDGNNGEREMEPLYFEDFEMDREYVTGSRTITETDVVMFAGLSGDYNPLHTNEEFARKTIFGTRIAHGLLGLSIASGLINQLGIGEGTVMAFLGMTWSFRAPLKFGDTITVHQRVAERRETSKQDRGIVRMAVSVINQHGEVVQAGEHTLMIKRRG